MHKVFLTLMLSNLILFSCSKDKQVPEAIQGLINEIRLNNPDCTCEPYINQYVWRRNIVYVLEYKGPACNWYPIYYNEDGKEINIETGYTFDLFRKDSRLVKNVWTCKPG